MRGACRPLARALLVLGLLRHHEEHEVHEGGEKKDGSEVRMSRGYVDRLSSAGAGLSFRGIFLLSEPRMTLIRTDNTDKR